MGRNSPPTEITIPLDSTTDLHFSTTHRATKRYTHADPPPPRAAPADRRRRRSDPARQGWAAAKKIPQAGTDLCFYCAACSVTVLFLVAMIMPQRLVRVGKQVATPWGGGMGGDAVFRKTPLFVPTRLNRRFEERQEELKVLRSGLRVGVRPPRLALVLGSMKKDHLSLMLLTLTKCILEHGYHLEIFTLKVGEVHTLWEDVNSKLFILSSEDVSRVDWSMYEGVILSSLEASTVISSLKQEPFCSVPIIWIVQEDTLARKLPIYEKRGWMNLIFNWKSVFDRADVVVFPDFSLPMLHSTLDSENFYVIPGSPVDLLAADIYLRSHSKSQLRMDNEYNEDDLLILVIGNAFFDEESWDNAATMHFLRQLLTKYAKMKGMERRLIFLFLFGNSTDLHDFTLKVIASDMGFPRGSEHHYRFDSDLNSVVLMSDIVLYTYTQDEQNFPSLLLRAMSFGIPIIVPDMPIIKKHIVDKVTGFIYHAHNSETLSRAFSLAISETGLSDLAHLVANSEKLLSKDMFVVECLTDYMKLLENVVLFPSDTILPYEIKKLRQITWEWRLFGKGTGGIDVVTKEIQNFDSTANDSIVFSMEEKFVDNYFTKIMHKNNNDSFFEDFPTELDWLEMGEIKFSEDLERREFEELEERTEKTSGSWEYVYNAARKTEKKKLISNERDEGELERIGRPLCIYELYNGVGTWPFLHNGTIYRGVSLSEGVERSRSDDINAVERLPLLSDKHYSDALCEFGGMLSIANKVDNIHKIPWIGFQSWRAAGRKVSLGSSAEKVIEETIVSNTKGDVIYFWAMMEMKSNKDGESDDLNFWSKCDTLNGGNCRSAFEDAFRKMYGLPNEMPALPPMPADGNYWSVLHSWVMPTPSFLEFIMFSRMFIDSLDSLNFNTTSACLLGYSKLEKRHCYCRVSELLVNVWAYHSARKMVYLDPVSGELKEQHPIEQRKGKMWVKYFNFSLLKAMDLDLAEEADDGFQVKEGWLWPLTGEVHWQGILDRERIERFRKKEDRHKRSMEKLIVRQKHGYKQKALAG